MSQSSDNPLRQARRRQWAQKILPRDEGRAQEMRKIARSLSAEELEEIAQIWLAGMEAGQQGDLEALAFIKGTFGPWASELLWLRRS